MTATGSLIGWSLLAGGTGFTATIGAFMQVQGEIIGWDKILAGGGVGSVCAFIVWLFLKRDEKKSAESNAVIKDITENYKSGMDGAILKFADTTEKNNQKWAETTATLLRESKEREKESLAALHALIRDVHEKR